MAWTHQYSEHTELAVEALWAVLADVAGWPSIDTGIERLEVHGEIKKGSTFLLKPRGGPRLRFTIEDFDGPTTYSDACKLPGATMLTRHTLIPQGTGTTIEVEIEVSGPLSFLWARTVGRKHAEGLPKQTRNFIQAARRVGEA